ncbi:RHS repeat-associated core domain-containing protein [Pseudomonas sp. 148P]|uniref:RHS repeat-associated core domain-containing protein n=1 Tax=Pseudomonas ulcerans TaxID=3115852 RepID=A0ABU7I0V5_9PSED|nr:MULTISPECIES: RHS repeat-associated core domain-containing protein [unclassified Pseudomonas]MEE1926410.1 RHS repeat-associated core domain-containing protein [Pseudomonas sp. 147P]MEE1937455.1 RHS repeat-associated core domain-containing protein [Pseudomonas sp. 148P]
MNASVHTHTPVLNVIDGRGLDVRRVDYHRAQAGQAAQRRVQASRFDAGARLREQWDARLFGQQGGASQRQLTSLSDRLLLDESGDAGWQLLLPGDADQVVERWDTRGGHWQTGYDERVRPLWIREGDRLAERFTYGADEDANRRGRLVRHDDEAGSRTVIGYSLTGIESGETRCFLDSLDLPDWSREPSLEPGEGETTRYVHGPQTSEKLEQTDARGNRQVFRYGLNGQLSGLTERLADGIEHRALSDVHYNARLQVESRTAGNGVISKSCYDPADGRLLRFSSSLLDLVYGYDPLGNVLRIEDRSQPVRYFANQRIDPVCTFLYDSLSQLIEATGREAAGVVSGPDLPALTPDTSQLLNYREHYDYDASGNLLSLRHVGLQQWTRTFAVAPDSNRALPEPGDPATGFDLNGNLLELASGQPLRWSARNQLLGIRQVARAEGADDEEQYRYGADGQRLRKVVTRRVAGRMQRGETRYLPGLELHTRQGEAFAVVQVESCRCLVWSEGQPEGIAGPQWRYSVSDVYDSSALELDGEARIITHEGYYPFGGTAWWAGRSAVEAGYKTRRYSGRERDSTGLYNYGLRYYAPWLARWISPDPAGDVDGLNRYRMARNNPLRFRDEQGLMPVDRQEAGASDNDPGREERRQFVASHFRHKFPDEYMVGSSFIGADGLVNEFVGVYGETRWSFDLLYKRSSTDKRFHASDVLYMQSRLAKERYGISEENLETVEFENVVNTSTLATVVSSLEQPEAMEKAFLLETPLGRLAGRLLREIGLQPGGITVRPITNRQGMVVAANIVVEVEHPEVAVSQHVEPDEGEGVRVQALHIPEEMMHGMRMGALSVAQITPELPLMRRMR